MTQTISKGTRGKPQVWSEEELKKLAFDLKYRFKAQKLTPSLLERETGIGRNTWSRRLKTYLEELNNPVQRTLSFEESEIELPNIEAVFEKYGHDKDLLMNEFSQLENIIFQLYKELKIHKDKSNKLESMNEEIQELKLQLSNEKNRSIHYEQLYNNIIASSLYPHLHSQSPVLNDFGIKDNLIDFETNKERNTSLKELHTYFPDLHEKNDNNHNENNSVVKDLKNIDKLKHKYDF